MKRFFILFVYIFAFLGIIVAADSKFVVVIDAGHGGKDGGAVRGIYKEKDINLGVAKTLGELIEANFNDVKVVYTRKTDVFVDLDKRTQIANKAKANLFISIHTNSTAAKTTSASGADTYILGLARSAENLEVAKRENSVILLEDNYTSKYEGFDPNSTESYIIFEFMSNKYMEQSLQFADYIQKDFRSIAKRTDRGVRQAGFLVLRKTSMPSVLIELGFINNQAEAKYLSSRLGQRAMATAIYSGFKKYKREFDKKQGRYVSAPDKNEEPDDIIDEAIIKEKVAIEEDTYVVEDADTPVVKESARVKNIVEVPKKREKSPKKIGETSGNIAETTKKGNSTVTKNVSSKEEYRVQFLVSPKKLPDNSKEFKGLSPVMFYKDGSSYKYTCGSTTDYNEIIKIQRQVRAKFKDAFVVKFRNGERVK
ncbi:N-acetylmuramoyl-L-alanine amidase [Dysgonomonas sp. GY75]|uniref:N-acetylmuramoyl-L-alanine amidase family protein n=1 Tax=Dysgonomonas sp. GY75 TaxID=2780419 RepID=UPI00188362F2|nr:N-acetylmuramoyl-L-alanine amidase [Dysgonomonas sp. GY75]MBF0648493.1 N-acetylmuramoyl-L-alanine amidase [Dysgonomonas sp. GY75]